MKITEGYIDECIKMVLTELIKKIYFGDYYIAPDSSDMCDIPPIYHSNGNKSFHKIANQNEQKEVYECEPSIGLSTLNKIKQMREVKNADTN